MSVENQSLDYGLPEVHDVPSMPAAARPRSAGASLADRFPHYHKRCGYQTVDVYRVLAMFEVTDPCIQHAVKKLLVAGQRGAKDIDKDISEAIATLTRWQQMRAEERDLVETA